MDYLDSSDVSSLDWEGLTIPSKVMEQLVFEPSILSQIISDEGKDEKVLENLVKYKEGNTFKNFDYKALYFSFYFLLHRITFELD